MKIIKTNSWRDLPENFTGIIEFTNGTKYWYKEGKCHREDGPAIEYSNGYKEWYLEDEEYFEINLNDYVVLDYYKGKFGLMWYKILDIDEIIENPDIPGLIEK